MRNNGSSKVIHYLNIAITIGLIGLIIALAIPASGGDPAANRPLLLALAAYAAYIALSSLVTGKILGRLVFTPRDNQPLAFWIFFVIYACGAGLLLTVALAS